MRVVAVGADQRLRIDTRPEPEPQRDQVVVAVERCGVCGSDGHLLDTQMFPVGAVPGHEVAGIVVAAGPGVPSSLEGERVALFPCPRCGMCDACRRGDTQLCPAQLATFLGLGHQDGGFAERVVVPATSCVVVPRGTSAEQAAFAEPFAVGLHAAHRATANPEERILVLGAGAIGLSVVAALVHDGALNVEIADPQRPRAELATALGARVAATDGEPPPSSAFDVVFECAGSPDTPQIALSSARAGGRIILVGVTGRGRPVSLRSSMWTAKEVDVRPCTTYRNEESRDAVEAVAEGAADTILAAAAVVPLEAAGTAVAEMGAPGSPVKTLLDPTSATGRYA